MSEAHTGAEDTDTRNDNVHAYSLLTPNLTNMATTATHIRDQRSAYMYWAVKSHALFSSEIYPDRWTHSHKRLGAVQHFSLTQALVFQINSLNQIPRLNSTRSECKTTGCDPFSQGDLKSSWHNEW